MTSEKMERRGGGSSIVPSAIRARRIVFGIAVATFGWGVGCGGGGSEVRGTNVAGEGRSVVIEHEPCDEAGHRTVAYDTNNDGKPDIKLVMDGDRKICRITALKNEGRPSMFEYFDASGQIRRREFDDFGDGTANQIEHYEGGKLVRREFDTSNHGRLDTWDFFDPSTGKLAKRERDTTGSGHVDQWWTYDASGVTVARDRDGDGLPDPNATLTFDRSGALVANASGASEGDAGAPPAPEAPAVPDAGAPSTSTSTADAGATP